MYTFTLVFFFVIDQDRSHPSLPHIAVLSVIQSYSRWMPFSPCCVTHTFVQMLSMAACIDHYGSRLQYSNKMCFALLAVNVIIIIIVLIFKP